MPRFSCKVLVLVHLFSGERRDSDIQMWMEQEPALPRAIYNLLSVDVIYDSVAGDLSAPATQAIWLDFARRGCIAGAFSGPPCETWSKARALGGIPAISKGDGGPRIFRTMEKPERLSQLKIPELKQIILASRLLMFTIALRLEMHLARRFMVVEHPSCPDGKTEAWLPSIWKLYVVRAIASSRFAQQFTIYQGFCDGFSPKPTDLLVICGDRLDAKAELQQFQTRSTTPDSLDGIQQKQT